MRRIDLGVLGACLCTAPVSAQLQPYNDGHGREWRQVKETTFLTWDQLASICPQDGATPCAGIVGGKNLTGWIWATREQVTELFSYFAPDILANPSIGGSQYVLPALGFVGSILPTFAFYTTFGAYESVTGWTATLSPNGLGGRAFVSGEYPVFNGVFDVTLLASPGTSSQYVGAWLYKPVDCGITVQGGGGTLEPCLGGSLEIAITASGPGPFTYEWRKDGQPLRDGPTPSGSIVSGAGTPSLAIEGVSSSDSGAYQCVVTTSCGSAGSDTTFSSTCDADCDCDGVLGIDDFICFQTSFALSSPTADCDASGTLSIDDFICFQTLYAIGC